MKNQDSYLGEFEELVLLAILKLKDNAYGTTVREALEKATGRSISIGALYATFDRLERKGFVKSWQGEATPERGGRAKRYFEVEANGREALKQAEESRRQLVPRLSPALR
jgi:DNA-binding PadR family transcriptional regulator